MKKVRQHVFFIVCFLFGISVSYATPPLGQTLQINTHFLTVMGKPSWLLILRDTETGQVSPYLFDIKERDNFWVAFTKGHAYRVTASNISWGPYAKIPNFCHLENGILEGKSMFITLSGTLSPNRHTVTCHILKYQDTPFTVVDS